MKLISETNKKRHYLALNLVGAGANTLGIGANVTLYRNGRQQLAGQMPTQGYQSSVSPKLHFGLGSDPLIDSLRVVWPGGRQQRLTSVKADQLLTLREADARLAPPAGHSAPTLFREVPSPLTYAHPASTVNDFKRQPLLVNALSFAGPCMAKADVDGREDVFVGGGSGQAGGCMGSRRRGSSAACPNRPSRPTKPVTIPMPLSSMPTATASLICTCAVAATAICCPTIRVCRTGFT